VFNLVCGLTSDWRVEYGSGIKVTDWGEVATALGRSIGCCVAPAI